MSIVLQTTYKYTKTQRLIDEPRLLTLPGYPYPIAIGGDYVPTPNGCETCSSLVTTFGEPVREASEHEYQLVCDAYRASGGVPGLLIITEAIENQAFDGLPEASKAKK